MESVPKKRVARPVIAKQKSAPLKRVVKKATPQTKHSLKVSKVVTAKKPKKPTTPTGTALKKPKVASLSPAKTVSKVEKGAPIGEPVILITGSPSLRLKERALIYEAWYRERSHLYVHPVTQVFGYGFILFGFLTAFSISAAVPLKEMSLLAAIECALGSECSNLQSTSTTTDQTILLPQVQFITSIQIIAGQDTEFRIKVTNAATHSLFVVSLSDGRKETLSPQASDGDIYSYRLPSGRLDAGEYKIFVRALALGTQTATEFLGPVFIVPSSVSHDDTDEADTSHETLNTGTEDSEVETDSEETSDSSTIEEEEIRTVLEREAEVADEEYAAEPESKSETEVRPSLLLALTPGVMPAQYKISITPTYKYSAVELYARAENSTISFFLGIASPTATGWQYWLDASSLPTGKFRIIARGMDGKIVKDTAEIRFENTKSTDVVNYSDEEEYLRTKEDIERLTVELGGAPLSTEAATTSNLGEAILPPPPISTVKEPIPRHEEVDKANDILSTHSDDFNELLQSYASGVQSGDETVMRLSESALDEKIFTVLGDEVINSELETSVFTLETDIRLKLTAIKEQIKKVEELKRERTAEASSADSDGDGISDYDEYLIYGTNPNNPDSDEDGVTDGVEIGSGFDPLNASPEAIIRFNSPKEVAYVDDTVLFVEQVAPLLLYEENAETPMVQAEIIGRGLPNSFVTLYIFSDPIVVTVRTKDDGSFSYTFTKELDDGDHEVYAALTDNKGEIVVRSTPFRFIKEAQAFTYVDDATQEDSVVTKPAEIDAPYNTVAAMGVVSFGLILLLLGQTLRREEDKPVEPSV